MKYVFYSALVAIILVSSSMWAQVTKTVTNQTIAYNKVLPNGDSLNCIQYIAGEFAGTAECSILSDEDALDMEPIDLESSLDYIDRLEREYQEQLRQQERRLLQATDIIKEREA